MEPVSVGAVCIGGVVDAHLAAAMMINGRKRTHMTRLIWIGPPGRHGATGIKQENGRTGVGEEHFTQYDTVRDL